MNPSANPAERDNPPSTSGNKQTKRLQPEPRKTRAQSRDRNATNRAPDKNNPEPIETIADDEPTDTLDGPIRNTVFPTYKLFRKQHLALTGAEHHMEFLTKLHQNQQVPKGLKPKVTTTTVELPPKLFLRWEQAHLDLASTLRDILHEYWELKAQECHSESKKTYTILEQQCSEEELQIINSLISKANIKKKEDLTT